MLADFGYIGLYIIASVIFSILLLAVPLILRLIRVNPHHPNPIKNSIFECGMETFGKTWIRFNFRYYFYALVFLALDVLVVFIYPWAVGLKNLGYGGLVAVAVLLFIVIVGYLYAWKKKVLEWK